MKHNYNIKFNQDEPSDEQIRSHMDFDALLKAAKKEEAPKEAKRVSLIPRALAGSAIAATLAGVVFFTQFSSNNNTGYNSVADAYFKDQPYINPPFENITPQFTSYNMSADQGGNLKMTENAHINVPPSAFLDKDGKTISWLGA